MEHRKEVRLENIAKEVGVSIVTVSNALKGKRGVSDKLRKKIQDTAVSMGYKIPATENKKKELYNISVVVAERYVKDFPSFYMDIYRRVAQEVNKRGSISVLEVVNEEKERMKHGFSGFLSEEMAGIIIIGEMDRNYIASVKDKYHVPIVCIDYYDIFPDMDYIVCDSYGGMEQMTDLLFDAGCKKLMFVGTPMATGNIMDRYLGFCKAFEKRGIETSQDDIIYDRLSDGYDYKLRIELPDKLPDAFVCNCDKSANILIRKLAERGVKIPQDVSVVGFDHHYSSASDGLELTTYENDEKIIAQISVNALLKRIRGQKNPSGIRFVEGKIIYGNTVAHI